MRPSHGKETDCLYPQTKMGQVRSNLGIGDTVFQVLACFFSICSMKPYEGFRFHVTGATRNSDQAAGGETPLAFFNYSGVSSHRDQRADLQCLGN